MRVLIFLSVLAMGRAVIQEIILRESNGNNHTFQESIPNLSIYSFRKDIVQACQRTRIVYYSEINYGGTTYRNEPQEFCYNFSSTYKSARFYGHQNTEEDGVSLFTSINLRGEEIYVAWSPVSGITKRILSLGYSGKSSWTVFEGTNFNGKSACLPPPAKINHTSYYNEISKDLNLSRIGSLYRGCAANFTLEMRTQLLEAAVRN